MAPSKFDDLCKPAKDVLGDDYQDKGYGFKAKSKTNFEGLGAFIGDADGKSGGVLTTAIDLDANKGEGKCTPAKLTWKFPKPLGIAGIAFDKLEVDKDGKTKLEASLDKGLHGVPDFKLECKSGLDSLNTLMLGCTYTGIKEALLKAEFKALNPTDPKGGYTAEAAYDVGGGASVSLKSTPASTIDVGARYASGPFMCSATSKESFSGFTFHGFYKVNDEVKVAATWDTIKAEGSAGLGYAFAPGTLVKGKLSGVNSDKPSVSASLKKELAKGVTMTAGGNMLLSGDRPWTTGVAFSIE